MKVGILTWHKAINHGAILQTYASCKMLEQYGYHPVVLDYDWNLYNQQLNNRLKRICAKLRKLSPENLYNRMKVKKIYGVKKQRFQQFVTDYLPVGLKYDRESELDAVYIGSDMVFDIKDGFNPFMYGQGVASDYVFSYAASFGYATLASLKASPYFDSIKNEIVNLKSIGYRDQNTLEICEYLAPEIPKSENIDPVLCYGFENEIEEWDTRKWKNRKYILVYAYDSTMNDKCEVSLIRRFAKSRNLELVSCGYFHKWCDKCIPASPIELIEMFKHAEYVITDTFHGTVFSLIMHKNFVSLIRKNGFKVRYLLESVGLAERIVNDNLDKVLEQEPDYQVYDQWIVEQREKSKEFIINNLAKAKSE